MFSDFELADRLVLLHVFIVVVIVRRGRSSSRIDFDDNGLHLDWRSRCISDGADEFGCIVKLEDAGFLLGWCVRGSFLGSLLRESFPGN